jgi:hypothetical protein
MKKGGLIFILLISMLSSRSYCQSQDPKWGIKVDSSDHPGIYEVVIDARHIPIQHYLSNVKFLVKWNGIGNADTINFICSTKGNIIYPGNYLTNKYKMPLSARNVIPVKLIYIEHTEGELYKGELKPNIFDFKL